MSSCDCYRIGGPFIAEDPECPEHGWEAKKERERQMRQESEEQQHQEERELEQEQRIKSLERMVQVLIRQTAKSILVWPFKDAPPEYKILSTSGGDEDWLAFVPDHLKDSWIPWMEDGSVFGCAGVEEIPVHGGVVRIGSHS